MSKKKRPKEKEPGVPAPSSRWCRDCGMVLSERFYRNQMFGDDGRMKRTYAMFRLDMRCRAHTRLPGWQKALAHAAINYVSRL